MQAEFVGTVNSPHHPYSRLLNLYCEIFGTSSYFIWQRMHELVSAVASDMPVLLLQYEMVLRDNNEPENIENIV